MKLPRASCIQEFLGVFYTRILLEGAFTHKKPSKMHETFVYILFCYVFISLTNMSRSGRVNPPPPKMVKRVYLWYLRNSYGCLVKSFRACWGGYWARSKEILYVQAIKKTNLHYLWNGKRNYVQLSGNVENYCSLGQNTLCTGRLSKGRNGNISGTTRGIKLNFQYYYLSYDYYHYYFYYSKLQRLQLILLILLLLRQWQLVTTYDSNCDYFWLK